MSAAAPIFTAAGAAVPCSAFRRGAGRHAAVAAREAAQATRECGGGGGDGSTTAAAIAASPIASPLLTHRVFAEYLYLGGSGTDMRSVTRVVEVPRPASGSDGAAAAPVAAAVVAALPLIAVDGAATRQGGGKGNHCSALFLKPRAAWPDPLRGGGALLVLCEAYSPPALALGGSGSEAAKRGPLPSSTPNSSRHPAAAAAAPLSPHPTNNRAFAERAARAAGREEPLFAVTQQYLLCEGDGRPLGWTAEGPPKASCYGSPDGGVGFFPWNGTGAGTPPFTTSAAPAPAPPPPASSRGRAVADAHLAACLSAGLAVTGCRAERASGQWSFSLGPLPPLEAADQLWAARWLLRAVAGPSALVAVTDALPRHLSRLEGPGWGGNGCRVKFSTRATRDASPGGGGAGRRALRDAIGRLAAAHAAHMIAYGAGAARRCEWAAARKWREEEEEAGGGGGMAAEAASLAPLVPHSAPPVIQQQQQQKPRFAGVEDPGAFLRIPAAVALHGRGHLEDARPAGGCCPYLTFTLLLCTTLGLPLPLPLPLPGGGDALSSPGAAAPPLRKRARWGGEQEEEEEEEEEALLAARRRRLAAPLASAAASGSGENLCPNANQNNMNRNAAAISLLACDEQVAESAQEDAGGDEENGGSAPAATAAPVENCDLDDSDDDEDDGGGARSSVLLLADDDDDDEEDDLFSTPVTPTRDAADGGATTVAGPDNREASSSPKRRRSSDLDDDASSSGGS